MKATIWIPVIVIILAAGGYFFWNEARKPGPLDAFAQCLKDQGAIFYGAFWCPHCQNQKKMFGRSQKLLPYIECSTADGRSQLPVCTEKKIEGYPTWVFTDGTRESGEIPLETLSVKTGCPLPQ